MNEISNALISIPEMTQNFNSVKDLVLETLFKEKIITDEQRKKYESERQIIMVERSWFKKWCDVFSPEKRNDWMIKYVNFEE